MSRSLVRRASIPGTTPLRTTKSTSRALAVSVISAGLIASGGLVSAPSSHAAPTGTTAVTAAQRTLLPGMKGADVRRAQKQTYSRLTYKYSFDTVQHVKVLQRILHLKVTGVTTRQTWNALNYMLRHGGRTQSGHTYRALYVRYIRAIIAKKAAARARMTAGSFGAKVVRYAKAASGRPYRYGATGPSAFDCSGYTGYVYRKAGKRLPRTANQQKNHVKRIPRSMVRAGDLIFFVSGGGRAYHVGIYAKPGYLYHSSRPGKPTGLGKIWGANVVYGTMR